MAYPDAPWHWENLLYNKNITERMINENPQFPWPKHINLYLVGKEIMNADLPISPDLPYDRLYKSRYVSWEEAKKNLNAYNSIRLSQNKNITIENALEFPEFSWYWHSIVKRKETSWEHAKALLLQWKIDSTIFIYKPIALPDILALKNIMTTIRWEYLSQNKYLTWKIVRNTLDCSWNFKYLSSNESVLIPLEHLRNLKDKLNWTGISMKRNLTLEFVQNNLDLPWNWDYLIEQLWLTTEFIEKNLKQIDAKHVYSCEKIPIEYMIKAKHSPAHLITRKDITPEIIEKYPQFEWPQDDMIRNEGVPPKYLLEKYKEKCFPLIWCREDLTLAFIRENIKDVGWASLSFNKFNIEENKARVIQRNWRIYKRKRILRGLCDELAFLPPAYIHENFVGGEEYRKGEERFTIHSVN